MKQLIFITSLFLFACHNTSTETILNETIYVRHAGADMPAHVHGNFENKNFLVVIHGAGSYGLAFRDGAFTSKLEKDYVVVYFDQRGQSMSQGHYKKPEDVIALMAQDVVALCAVLRHKYGDDIKLFLMGHSMGGLVTGRALLEPGFQDQLNGWVNVAGLLDLPSAPTYRKERILAIADEQIDLNNQVSDWEALREETIDLDPNSDEDYGPLLNAAGRAIQLLTAEEYIRNTTSSEKLYNALIKNNPINWQVSHFFNKPVDFARSVDYSLNDQLDEIQLPVLFIYGKYDVSVPSTLGATAFFDLGSSDKEFRLFESTIHHPHDTEPGMFYDELRLFINLHQ